MQEKEYPFPDSDIPEMLEDLLKSKLIELPEMKRPEEAGRVNDPMYCKYHRLVSHPVEKRFVLKEKIMDLTRKGMIELDVDVVTSNQATITFGSCDLMPLSNQENMNKAPVSIQSDTVFSIKFGAFEPIEVKLTPSHALEALSVLSLKKSNIVEMAIQQDLSNSDDEGWTLVTRRRGHKSKSRKPAVARKNK